MLLVINLLPCLCFYHRFVPRHPATWLRDLQTGGKEQRQAVTLVEPANGRLLEQNGTIADQLFPNATAHFAGIHVVQGYSALQPRSAFRLSPAQRDALRWPNASVVYEASASGAASGSFKTTFAPGSVRFQWAAGDARSIRWTAQSLNHIVLDLGDGAAQTLIWTDTYDKGWTARLDGQPVVVDLESPCYSRLGIPAGAHRLELDYRPRTLPVGLLLAGLTATALVAVRLLPTRKTTIVLSDES